MVVTSPVLAHAWRILLRLEIPYCTFVNQAQHAWDCTCRHRLFIINVVASTVGFLYLPTVTESEMVTFNKVHIFTHLQFVTFCFQNPVNGMHPPTFYLTEHATLMFMLPYQRLDNVTVRTGSCPTALTTYSSNTSAPVYVVFTGDGGVSTQQLRCDTLSWGLNLSAKIREAQFRYIQAAFSLFRTETAAGGIPYSSQLEVASSRLRRAPLIPGHPMALSYPPVTSLGVKRLL